MVTEETIVADVVTEEKMDADVVTKETINADVVTKETIDADVVTEETIDADVVNEETINAGVVSEETIVADVVTEETMDADMVTKKTTVDTDVVTEETIEANVAIDEDEVNNELKAEKEMQSDVMTAYSTEVLDYCINCESYEQLLSRNSELLQSKEKELSEKNTLISELLKKFELVESSEEDAKEKEKILSEGNKVLGEKIVQLEAALTDDNLRLNSTIKKKNMEIERLQSELDISSGKNVQLSEDRSRLMTENAQLKNNKKALQVDVTEENQELKAIKSDLNDFKRFMWQEVGRIKESLDTQNLALSKVSQGGVKKSEIKTSNENLSPLTSTPTASQSKTGTSESTTAAESTLAKANQQHNKTTSGSGSLPDKIEEVLSSRSPESDRQAKEQTNSEQRERKQTTLIFTTSISKGIKPKRFNNCVDKVKNAKFVRFHGARAKHMPSYVTPRILEENPSTVIIHAGGNDLPVYNNEKAVSLLDIANSITDAGLVARRNGTQHIFISGVTTRRGNFLKKRCEALNGILMDLCKKHKFHFINNEGITDVHLSHDGVHLNESGTNELADNYLDALKQLSA